MRLSSRAAWGLATALVAGGCSLLDLGGLQAGASGSGGAGQTTSATSATDTSSRASASGAGGSGSAYADTVALDHPIAYYRFDDGAGTVAKDSAGTFDGGYVGTVIPDADGAIAGDPSKAIGLGGNVAAVVIPNAFDFAGHVPFSIELWVRPRMKAPPEIMAMFEKSDRNPRDGYTLLFYDDLTPAIERWAGGNADVAQSAAPVLPNSWHHLVATYDADGTLRFYTDGIPGTETQTVADLTDDDAPAVIGGFSDLQQGFLLGEVDEVAVYDYALSQDRITTHWHAGTGT